MCGRNITWCRECERGFTTIVFNLLYYNYSDVYNELQRYGRYNLRSRGKSMFNVASIFHGVSENFFPNNFHKLRVPDNLLRFCISINSRRIGTDVIPSDNLYWFITNCGMCDECWSIEDAEPNANNSLIHRLLVKLLPISVPTLQRCPVANRNINIACYLNL